MRARTMVAAIAGCVLAAPLVVAVPLAVPAAQAALVPPAPPPPVIPPPHVREVTTPGPTWLPAHTNISRDVVWSPQGSPYVIPADGIVIHESGSVTLLPGTIVKFTPTAGAPIALQIHGPLYALGTPDRRVVFTSLFDDSVGGDTNGDGSATAPARGDWGQIFAGGPTYLDYVDVRYGGGKPSALGCAQGAIYTVNEGHLVLTNSRITESASSGVAATGNDSGYAGVFGNEFDTSRCGGFSDLDGLHLVIGNTFGPGLTHSSWYTNIPERVVFRYNVAHRPLRIAWLLTTAAEVDARFNRLLAGFDLTAASSYRVGPNWYGRDINLEQLPPCLTQAQMDAYVPRLTIASFTSDCPPDTYPPRFANPVLPALSGPPPGIPQAVLDASSASFGPVSTSGGWLTYRATDMVVEDAGKTLTAARTYSSRNGADSDAGPGWSTSYSEALSTFQGVSSLALSDGSSLPFAVDPAAGYVPGGGVDADFVTGPAGSTITTTNRTSYQFDPAGELVGLLLGDPGHQVDVDRVGGRLARVTGESGRYLNYSRVGGRLVSVTDSQARSIGLTYTNERLAAVSGVDGQAETYEYDGDGRLVKVTAPSGLVRLTAGYRADGKVAWITEAGRGRADFGYDAANRRTTITRADGSQVVQQYDPSGRLIVEQTVGGSATHVLYDGFGRQAVRIEGIPSVAMENYRPLAQAALVNDKGDVVTRIDPAGRATTATYNSAHKPLVTTYPDGGTVSRGYDGDGRLARVTDQVGKSWDYTYNSRGQVLTVRNPLNQTRQLSYQPDGDLESIVDETGAVTGYEYDGSGRPTGRTDPAGHRWLTGYTAWGEARVVTTPGGVTTTREYSADRRLTAIEDGTGARTGYEYDAEGRLSATVDALGQRATTEYDGLGRATRITDGRGYAVHLAYSPGGFVTSSTAPEGTTTIVNDPAGRPVRTTDPLGQVTQTVYDPAGPTIRVDRPDGGSISSTLDAAGRVAKETTALGNNTMYAYDLAGRLLERTDPLGHSRQWGYDALGRTTTVTDELGRVTTQAYDDAQRTVTVTDGLGPVSVTAFDALGQVVSDTDGSGRTNHYEYTVDGLRSAAVDSGGGRTRYEYDTAGRLMAVVDPLGRRTAAELDALGRTTRTSDPAGRASTYTYEPGGQVATETDRTGAVRRYTYDPRGLLTATTDPLGNVTTYGYDALGRPTSTVDPTGVERHTGYDPAGRPAVTWDITGASWLATYDLDGNVLAETDPAGVTMRYKYNRRGQRTDVQWGSATLSPSKWVYTYDAVGDLISVKRPRTGIEASTFDQRHRLTSTTRPDGTTTTTGYDGAGRRTSETAAGGGTTTWTYDAAGRMATAMDPLGNTARYQYDAAGQLTTLTLPRGGAYGYGYDAVGAIVTETDPNGGVTQRDYDPEGRPVRTATPAGRIEVRRYDTAGRLGQSEADAVVRQFGYDGADRLVSTQVSGQPDVAFSYDNRGLLATSADRLGTTGYSYDSARRLTAVTPPGGTATTYTYKPDNTFTVGAGLLATVRGPVNVDYTYNSEGDVTERRFVAPGASRRDTFAYNTTGRVTSRTEAATAATTYTYTPAGQVDTVTEPVAGGSPTVTDYGYDNAGRLTSQLVTRGGTTVSQAAYGWDADGNRTSADGVTYAYDLSGRLTTSSDGVTYDHDADGALVSVAGPARVTTYGYNGFGELATARQEPGDTVTYTRDALGRLSSRTVDGATRRYGYGGSSYTVTRTALDGSAATEVIRGHGGETLAQASTGSTLRAGTNVHSDITSWQNSATGAVVGQTRFDPFGTVVEATGPATPANLGYQGDVTDATTGLVDMGFRPYDPRAGRFVSRDSIVGAFGRPVSLNRYAYGNGDPVNFLDPDGHWPQLFKDIVNGARDYFTWWTDSWRAGWNGTEPTVEEPAFVRKVNNFVDNHHDGIAEFTVSTLVFVGCEAALGIPTAGAGAVAGVAFCGALAGGLGGLSGQAVRCHERKTPDACDPAEFGRAGVTSGIGGLVSAPIGGVVANRIVGSRLAATLGRNVFGRTAVGTTAGGTAGTLSGAAGGGAGAAAYYGMRCQPRCSLAGLGDATWRGIQDGGLTGGIVGTISGGYVGATSRPPFDSTVVAPMRPPARQLLENEGVLLQPSQGLQSRTRGLFDNVIRGDHPDPRTRYLWTIDERGVNLAYELTPFPTPRGNIVHSNLSARASAGGEAWFGEGNTVTINASSGRFGHRGGGLTPEQWDAAARVWESLGYDVTQIPYGEG